MIAWMILTVMVAIAVALLTVPLVRRHDVRRAGRAASLAVLSDQLRDIDDQLAAGTVAPDEAEGLRLEIKRRMLRLGTAERPTGRPLGVDMLGRLAIGIAAVVALAAVGLYAMIGRPDLAVAPRTAQPVDGEARTDADPRAQLEAMLGPLKEKVATHPNDPEGWRLLGFSYFQTGRYREAAEAYQRAVTLAPDVPGNQSALGEAMVMAADGIVTPAASTAFAKAVKQDAGDVRARYFLALAKDQAGDRRGAIDDWLKLIAEAPADAPWLADLRRTVTQAASEAGIDISQRLPAAPRGPAAADIAAAEQMDPAQRAAMIQSMVDGLAARLAENPRDAAGWERLIRARSVLGDRAGSASALATARKTFADDAPTLARLDALAKELNL